MVLFDLIAREIHQRGPIPFVEFMHHALYAPDLGYYSAGIKTLGLDGDFVTAPELTPLFGQTLALQCCQVLKELESPILFEFGAGTGRLCVDLLTKLEHLDSLPHEYHILEVSASLAHQQQVLINRIIPHLAKKVRWLSAWPSTPITGVVVANEVLDAMPIHRFCQTEVDLFESHIKLNSHNELEEIYLPSTDERLKTYLQNKLPKESFPYQSEANLFMDGWFQQCYDMLDCGAMIILDYGFPRHEYYHSSRNQGTLMCHYRHRAHTNPLLYLGMQDITAHVDFTHVAEAAHQAGFDVAGFTNLGSFLLANGLLSLIPTIDDELKRINTLQRVRQLIEPHQMGELFKVMLLSKKIDLPWQGFQLDDKRASL